MASLIGERIRFLHMPKTGGSWATQAMFAGGVQADRPPDVPFHGALAETAAYADRFTFACVRHPLELWRSYWAYRNRTGWIEDHPLDRFVASADLNEFATRLVDVAPGHISEQYERFVGPPGQEIDYICRHERLTEDLCRALILAGEPFDEQALRAQTPVNRSDYGRSPALYTPRTAELLAASERQAIERFYHWDPIPGGLVAGCPASAPEPHRAARIAALEIARRDAVAELRLMQCRTGLDAARIEALERRLEDSQRTLTQLRNSSVIRWTRRPRTAWHRIRSATPARRIPSR